MAADRPAAMVRDPACVERWPECEDGAYNPNCCRFPKSCSCTIRRDAPPSDAAANTRSVCCKCGGDDVLKRWHPGKGRYGQGGCGFSAQVVGYTEHLHCTCRTCQFEWMEETLDNLA